MIVGFAAETGDETGDALHHGRAKLARKGCDLLVVNAVGEGRAFEVADNAGWLLGADGHERELASGSKALLASRVWDAVAARLRSVTCAVRAASAVAGTLLGVSPPTGSELSSATSAGSASSVGEVAGARVVTVSVLGARPGRRLAGRRWTPGRRDR